MSKSKLVSSNTLVELYPSVDLEGNTFHIWNGSKWLKYDAYESFHIKKVANQMSEFEVGLVGIEDDERAYFKEGNRVLFFSGKTLILKGVIDKIDYSSDYEVKIRGFGMESKLMNRELIKDGDKRVEYSNISAKTIAEEINNNLITKASDGLWSTDYGQVSLRFEYANRLNAFGTLAEAIKYDWWVSQKKDDDYQTDYLNIKSYRGSQTSVETFELEENATSTEREVDTNELTNYVDCLGYGDGINQLSTNTYQASSVWSLLASNLTKSATTIPLLDASTFPSSGQIRISKERITYTGKSGNNLTGATRGANGTEAKPHLKDVYTEKYVLPTSPEANSSIQKYNLREYTVIDKTIIDEQTLELVASRYLLDRIEPIIQIKIIPDEPQTAVRLEIGDKITIDDPTSDIDGDFRIVSLDYNDYYGDLELEIGVSNHSLAFVEQMQKAREQAESMAKYMQGATNIYTMTEHGNCDTSYPLNLSFYIPDEVKAINRVKLNFQTSQFTDYSSTTANESEHTHGIPSLDVYLPKLTSSDDYTAVAGGSSVVDTKYNDGGITSSYGSWQTVTSFSPSYTTTQGMYVTGTITRSALTSAGGWVDIRVRSSSGKYFPDSGGVTYPLVGNTSGYSGADFSIFCPEDTGPRTYYLEVRTSHQYFYEVTMYTIRAHDHTVYGTTIPARTLSTDSDTSNKGSAHNHGVSYGFIQDTFPSGTPQVEVSVNGSPVSTINVSNFGTYEVDITDRITNLGAGNWATISFKPKNGSDHNRMMINASIFNQVFIQSV